MKRNITVNIFGSLYNIDEDAYRLLDAYLVNIRDYFSRQSDGREIADDIEARVAELMSEIRTSGRDIINISDVESIIGRIGNPEDLGVFEDAEASCVADEDRAAACTPPEPPAELKPKRKLFRDTHHRVLGGVLAGMAKYFNVNPLWLRLAALVVEFFFILPGEGFFIMPILAYVACWILIPSASTPAERLQMKGEPINLASLRDEFLKGARDLYTTIDAPSVRSTFVGGISAVVRSLGFAAVALTVVFCAVCLLSAVFCVTCYFSLPDPYVEYFFGKYSLINQVHTVADPAEVTVFAVGVLLSLALIMFIGIHWLMRRSGRATAMPGWIRWIVILLFVVSLVLTTASWARIVAVVSVNHDRLEPDYRAEQLASEREHIEELGAEGWTLSKGRNLSDGYMDSGEHYSGRKQLKYLNGLNKTGSMDYEVVRTVRIAPGTYELKAVARTDGRGCEIFAINGVGERRYSAVEPCGAKGGDVWAEAVAKVRIDSLHTSADYQLTKNLAHANGGRGYGWQRVSVGSITVGSDSVLTYGVTNMSPTTVWDGTFVSATAFELRRL